MPFDDVLSRCLAKWSGEKIPLGPPIREDEIRREWERFGRRVSRDVLRLYSTVGGFAEWCFDKEFIWALWPWTLLLEQNAATPSEGVQFCDHSINVVTWELRFEDERHSSIWQISHSIPGWSQQTAPNLKSFFRTYLDDPWRLL